MQVDELRIGNYVSHPEYSDEFFVVKSITADEDSYMVDTVGGSKGTWSNDAKAIIGIPLTAEMLESAGFKRYVNANDQSGYKLEDPSKCLSITLLDDKTLVGHYGTQAALVEHVHELQNLYYTLTAEELNIALETI